MRGDAVDLLPRHGVAYATLLLAYTAELSRRESVEAWANAAMNHGSYLAVVTDLRSPAHALIEAGLASVDAEKGVCLARPLAATATASSPRHAMRHVAVVLLSARPPEWLRIAVDADRVEHAYIPQQDVQALDWLEDELDDVLIQARELLQDEKQLDLSKAIGDVAEEVVVSALKAAGKDPVHVARISDAYGYDVDVPGEQFLEIKAAGPRTADRFHLSRHEYDISVRRSDHWCLVQVIFEATAFVADRITAADVREIRELPAPVLSKYVPADTLTFRWEDTAVITPSPESWQLSTLRPDPAFTCPGFSHWEER